MKNLVTLLMLFVNFTLLSQNKLKHVTISGSVDTYYQTYLTAADDLEQSFGTSFANETGFALGMANLIASYNGKKAGVVADVVFGPRGESAASSYNLNRLYAYWNVSETTTLTMGRFNTYLGYEVIAPAGNFNYSMSYLFSNGPFSHVGLKADFALSDDFSLMLAVINPTDVNNNLVGSYAFGAQLGYAGQFLNFYYDDKDVLGFEADYTGGFNVSEKIYLGINAAYQTMNSKGFYGAALYPQYTISDTFGLGLRGELFGYHMKDNDNPSSVLSLTLTGNYAIEGLIIKPEIRIDSWHNNQPYLDSQAMATKSLAGITIAAIYAF